MDKSKRRTKAITKAGIFRPLRAEIRSMINGEAFFDTLTHDDSFDVIHGELNPEDFDEDYRNLTLDEIERRRRARGNPSTRYAGILGV